MTTGGDSVNIYNLSAKSELRLEVTSNANVSVKLLEGAAEIFGSELLTEKNVRLNGQKVAIFTWTGCKLVVTGDPSLAYVANETPMAQYLNVHTVMNNRRKQALETKGQGPRCIILGPTDSGKSSLCKIFVNYAVRSKWQPIYVDLDIGQGSITTPATIGATPVEQPIDIEEGYPIDKPLVYYFGHVSPSENAELYKFQLDRLAAVLDKRCASSPQAAASGFVINTMGWIEGLGYELQVHAIQALKADVIIVIDQDRLQNQLVAEVQEMPELMRHVVKVPKSGGAVTRERDFRKSTRDMRTREYFYGPFRTLRPASERARADDLIVFRIGGIPRAPSSALPIGAVSAADPLRLVNVTINHELINSLLAVSHANTPDQVLTTNVAGFVYVTDVDVVRGFVTYLAPCTGPLPGRYLISGSFKPQID